MNAASVTGSGGSPRRGLDSEADQLVDDFVDGDADWRRLVMRYPKVSLMVAAIGGYVLASRRGDELVTRLGDYAAHRVGDSVNELLGEDVV